MSSPGSDPGSYMGTPAEVGHLLQGSVSEFPLEELMELRRQEVTDLIQRNQYEKEQLTGMGHNCRFASPGCPEG